MIEYQLHHLPDSGHWLEFSDPLETITADRPEQVLPALRRIQTRVNDDQLVAAGWVGYGASSGLDPSLPPLQSPEPLLKFSLYQQHRVLTELPAELIDLVKPEPELSEPASDRTFKLTGFDELAHARAVEQIKDLLRSGDTYQVNYTQQLHGAWPGSSSELFRQMLAAQPSSFAAYLVDDQQAICSVSPELFFCLDKNQIRCRPMKGTARRGRFTAEDQQAGQALTGSAKDQAENLMIVDMVRNDLGRIAVKGSVQVDQLFKLEQYPTVWQLTSTVSARTHADLATIFQALFPCASIVGAPKRRTMEIIESIEQVPRGLYTGAIGWLAPEGRAQFNVAIRTARLGKNSTVNYGVGGGIVWDSNPAEEAQECIDKSRVLAQPPLPDVALLETLRWSPAEGYWLLSEHLQRLAESALFLNYVIDQQQVLAKLELASHEFGRQSQRVRLTLTKQGRVEISHQPLQESLIPVKLALYSKRMLDTDLLRFHKSDPRPWLADVAEPVTVGADDWLFMNSRGEITESTIANLVIRMGSRWITPAVNSGLLAGTYRRRLISTGVLQEQVVTPRMLQTATEIGLINSVRGWRPAILVE